MRLLKFFDLPKTNLVRWCAGHQTDWPRRRAAASRGCDGGPYSGSGCVDPEIHLALAGDV